MFSAYFHSHNDIVKIMKLVRNKMSYLSNHNKDTSELYISITTDIKSMLDDTIFKECFYNKCIENKYKEIPEDEILRFSLNYPMTIQTDCIKSCFNFMVKIINDVELVQYESIINESWNLIATFISYEILQYVMENKEKFNLTIP